MSAKQTGTIAVVGAGTMGAGIAQCFAQAGFEVLLVDSSSSALERAVSQMQANLRLLAEFGIVDENVQPILERVKPCEDLAAIESSADLKLVIESVPEDLEIKRALFAALDGLDETVILASNTSSFTMSAITAGLNTAHRAVGLHYFNPPHIIPAVEVHRGSATSEDAIAAARELVESTGKVTIMVQKEIAGFVINRLTGALEREVDLLLDEGVVSPEDLDKAVKASLGFRLACLGPMEAEDMIGLDVAARVSGNIFKILSNATEPSPELVEKVERGELGLKSGRGWYDYPDSRKDAIVAERNARLLRQLALYRGGTDGDGGQS